MSAAERRHHPDPFFSERKSMPEERKKSWNEADVQALIGQSESIRREFKAGLMFDRKQESEWVKELSIEVSALANTEGGDLIWGIQEDGKTVPRVGKAIDGLPKTLDPQRLQQLIEGNVSPYLPGIRFHRVKLTEPVDRVVYVIQVPQGSTAYQANDRRYYGRSEFEAKPLPDHEVRLRMMRGQVAQVDLDSIEWICRTEQRSQECLNQVEKAAWALEEAKKITETERFFTGTPRRMREITPEMRVDSARSKLESAKRDLEASKEFDEFSFLLQLTNVGGTTIRDFLCVVRNAGCESLFIGGSTEDESHRDIRVFSIGSEIPYRFAEGRVTRVTSQGDTGYAEQTQWQGLEKKLFPQENTVLPFGRWLLRVPRATVGDPSNSTLEWTVFLDDVPPSRGVIILDPGQAIPARGRTTESVST
jgi:hypothetical protein